MRRVLASLTLALGPVLGASAQRSALRDGDLQVPIPDQWVIWRPAEISAANPHVPEGHTVVGMAAEHSLGHPDPQATVTLERLDLRRLGLTGMDSVQLAETHFVQMRRDAPGFEAEGEVFATRLGDRAAHGWQGILPVPMGQRALRLRVWQTAAVQGDTAHLLTFYLPEEGAPSPAPTQRKSEPPQTPVQPPGGSAWTLGSFTLPLPPDWVQWPSGDVDRMQSSARQADQRVADVNGITLPGTDPGGFQPSVAGAVLTMAEPITSEQLVELAADSAERTAAGTLSGEVALEATAFRMADRAAAIAVVSGAVPDRGDLRAVRIDQLWVDGGDSALRFVIVTDLDDDATRQTIGQMLATMRD